MLLEQKILEMTIAKLMSSFELCMKSYIEHTGMLWLYGKRVKEYMILAGGNMLSDEANHWKG